MAAGATVPGVCSLHNPALPDRRKACCSFRSGLYFHVPARTIRLQPSVQRMVMILVVAKDRLESGEVLRGDLTKQFGSGGSVVNVGAGNQHGDEQAQRDLLKIGRFAAAMAAAIGPGIVPPKSAQTFDEGSVGRGFLQSPVDARDPRWPERPRDSSPGSSDAVAQTQGQDAREFVVRPCKGRGARAAPIPWPFRPHDKSLRLLTLGFVALPLNPGLDSHSPSGWNCSACYRSTSAASSAERNWETFSRDMIESF